MGINMEASQTKAAADKKNAPSKQIASKAREVAIYAVIMPVSLALLAVLMITAPYTGTLSRFAMAFNALGFVVTAGYFIAASGQLAKLFVAVIIDNKPDAS